MASSATPECEEATTTQIELINEGDSMDVDGSIIETGTGALISNGEESQDGVPEVGNLPEQGTRMVDESEESKNSQERMDEDGKKSEEDGEDGVKCGFLVDRISTQPYEKAMERGEVPFCAFAPISTQDFYLLRIQECADSTRHMLVPASREEVFSMPGALKPVDDDQEPGNEESMNYKVAIVAIARQIYSEEDKQLVVSVDPPMKKDKKKLQVVKFLTLDKFADFAFLGFDGNVSEFANANSSTEPNSKENTNGVSSNQCDRNQNHQPSIEEQAGVVSTPAVPLGMKSPPKAPARRGRGGRRRMSRKSPSSSVTLTLPPQPHLQPGQFYPPNFQQLSSVTLPHGLPTDFTQAFIKMEQGDAQHYISHAGYHAHQIQLSQVPVMDASMYTQDAFITPNEVSMPMLQVPAPVSEVTVSTTEPGADAGAQQTNHDLITIAFDQLVGMSSEVQSTDMSAQEKSSRGGRRGGPGRKPGRKPLKERHPNQIDAIDENAMFTQLINDEVPTVPKRRGRPPKNRNPVPPPVSQENENSNPGGNFCLEGELREEFESYEKRVKMQMMEQEQN